jgi:Zinc carboxypeptidase.
MEQHNIDTAEIDDDATPFNDAPIDRRTFLGVVAATGAAVSLPDNAVAGNSVQAPQVGDVCQFVLNNTPDEYETAVVVEFADTATADWFDKSFQYDETDRHPNDPEKTVIRTQPTPAGHGLLTATEVSELVGQSGVKTVKFSPGANPFWRLTGGYENGVFPDPIDARGYLSYAEAVAGVTALESAHPDYIRTHGIGQSPGWHNRVTGADEQFAVRVVELTNEIGDSVADKKKAIYSLSIHGDERAGAEAGIRLIEAVLTGDAPDVAGLLDDIMLVFVWANPDGWVAREPWTAADNTYYNRNFQRRNGGTYNGTIDPNRQYPTAGWINPEFLPAEPDGAPAVFHNEVPDALSVVEWCRDYENVALVCDYHGMYLDDHMMFQLEGNGSFDHAATNFLDELSRQTGQALQEHWGGITAIEADVRAAAETEYGSSELPSGDQFNGLLDWGSIYDTIGYQTTGGLMGWASTPEQYGGLGAVGFSPEIIISNNYSWRIKQWKPWWSRHYATAYRLAMCEHAQLAAAETTATVATGGS